MSVRRPLAGLASAVLVFAACSGSGTPPNSGPTQAGPSAASASAPADASAGASVTAPPSPSESAGPSPVPTPTLAPTPAPTPTPVPTPTPAPTPAAFTLDATVWWAGYLINVTGGTWDPLKHSLVIDATFKNTSTQQAEVSQASSGVRIVWNGQFLPGNVTPGAVPVGATARARIVAQMPVGFSGQDAVLTFGAPDEHQAIVPLNGDPATSDTPVDLVVSGKVKMGKYAAFTVTRGVVVPAACSGYPERIKYGPLTKGEVSIVLWGVATNTNALNDALIDQGFLLVPDGTTAARNPTGGIYIPAKGTIRNDGMCFDVPAPGSGSYKLTLHEYRARASGSMTFVIP